MTGCVCRPLSLFFDINFSNALYLPNGLSLRNAKIEIHPTKDSAVQLHRPGARFYPSSSARASDSDAPVQPCLWLL